MNSAKPLIQINHQIFYGSPKTMKSYVKVRKRDFDKSKFRCSII